MYLKKGQSTLEYVILMIIIIAVFLSMQNYIKRGLQGRWKEAVDDLADQYDPKLVNANVVYTIVSNSETEIRTIPDILAGKDGYWTNRTDTSVSKEYKDGYIHVGAE